MSSPPILALHGNLGSSQDWESTCLSNLTAVDLWEYTELDFFEMAHRLATDLSRGMERPVIAGYSLGGRLALHAMAIHPERWGGAVILSAHPGLDCVEDRMARRISDEVWAGRARELPWEKFLAAWNEQGVLADSPVSDEQTGLASRRGEIALAFETWSLGRQENLRSQLRRFHAPVLWITGETDSKFTVLAEGMGEVFPRFQRATIPGAGHRVLGEGAGEIISKWLSSAKKEFSA
ncbi:MAG: alpha/beta fold hydrolase [Verrucomicrobiales bacterium]|nr:alpha/beta fold hydrolase [Verrucomicrobiales bacterium]